MGIHYKEAEFSFEEFLEIVKEDENALISYEDFFDLESDRKRQQYIETKLGYRDCIIGKKKRIDYSEYDESKIIIEPVSICFGKVRVVKLFSNSNDSIKFSLTSEEEAGIGDNTIYAKIKYSLNSIPEGKDFDTNTWRPIKLVRDNQRKSVEFLENIEQAAYDIFKELIEEHAKLENIKIDTEQLQNQLLISFSAKEILKKLEAQIIDQSVEHLQGKIKPIENTCKAIEEEKISLETERKELHEKKEQLENTIKEKQEQLDSLIKEKQEQLENIIKEKQEQLDNLLKEKQGEIEKMEIEYERYHDLLRKYGLCFEEESETIEPKKKEKAEELIERVWLYLGKEKELYYDKSVISRFLDSLHTNQLTILWGKPGTGKTSLPMAVAEAMDAICVRIAVQPSWNDNQDLLGYYNVMQKKYMPTSFTNALVEAKEDPNHLYFIMLDEMNLAHIEYYFSEVLSAIAMKDSDEKNNQTLTLYSQVKRKREQNKFERLKELSEKEEPNEEESKELEALLNQIEDMLVYPPEFDIPKNVRFIGTLNMDATTKDISPKVIDRSYMLEVTAINKEIKQEIKTSRKKPKKQLVIPGHFTPIDKGEEEMKEDENIMNILGEIDRIKKLFEKYTNTFVSNRFDRYLRQTLAWNADIDLDYLVLDKILSNVKFSCIDEDAREKLESNVALIKQELGEGFHRTKDKLECMKEEALLQGESHYWS